MEVISASRSFSVHSTALRFALRCLLFLLAAGLPAAEWQWSVPVDSITLRDGQQHPRAFLWIPVECSRIRGVVVSQHNMLEEGILEHPYFRQTLSDLGLAEVWVVPGFDDPVFRFDQGMGEKFDRMMNALAAESGYAELAFAPIVPMGHSACASYPWNFAAWNPKRTLAVLSVHGDAPQTNRTGSGRPNPDWGDRNIDGIPGLMVMGEFEWGDDRLVPAMAFRAKHPGAPIAFLADAGHGHFDFSDRLVSYLAMFLRKAVAHRLPVETPWDKPLDLQPIDPHQGWLVDRWRPDAAPTAEAAPLEKYTGDPREAFWCFDEEMAKATQNYDACLRGKSQQLLSFVQKDQPVSQSPKSLEQIGLAFSPVDDGMTFDLAATFSDTVTGGNPARWAHLPAGSKIGHASGGGPVMISRICGPAKEIGPGKWAIQFSREGMDNSRASDIWFVATHPGDDKYRSAVQQAKLHFPSRNTEGTDQQIDFPAIPDLPNSTQFLKLAATSDAKVPVHYYVREGPAEVFGDTVKFTGIPPRARFPLKLTVVAWQWGRSVEPRLKSAEPVERTFHLIKQ